MQESTNQQEPCQELVFTGGCRKEGERGDVVREEVARAQLERVATRSQWVRAVMSLRLPERCRTDASFQACPFLAVRFIVRLKLTFRLCSSMTCDVACHVGTKRSDVPVPKPTINLDRLSIYREERRGEEWRGEEWRGEEWRGEEWRGEEWRGEEWRGEEWRGEEWRGEEWRGEEWRGEEWRGEEWRGEEWRGEEWRGEEWRGEEWRGEEWRGEEWRGEEWRGEE
ncbi:hypothetical protein ACOMHN_022809 [Nucella lapillus]